MLERVSYIYYPLQFYQNQIWVLLNNENKIIIINSYYFQKLSLKILKYNVRIKKIYNSNIKISKIVIADFQIKGKIARFQYFQKIFLVANIKG